MLRTKGKKIIDARGNEVRLRGQNIGNWTLIEPNMFGTPGSEHRLRRAMNLYAGEEKTRYFFQQFLDKWVQESDIAFLAQMGCNSVRLPINYRYLESDLQPFHYLESGFALIDTMLDYCRKYGVYVIIDLHAVQGFQSGDWHCDNIFGEQVNIYHDAMCQDRYIELWKHIAERYKDEEMIAGYDLMNEPVAVDRYEVAALNKLYRETVAAIREIDPNHIIFIEGNYWAQDFTEMEEPFADNLVYSNHYYCDAATRKCPYPTDINGVRYDKHKMELDMDFRDQFMSKYNVPCWVGEFGARKFEVLADKDQVLKDYLAVYEERGHSWCYWSFKDIYLRGVLYLDPDCAWMSFMKDIIALKEKYHTDRSNQLNCAWDLSSVFKGYREGDFKKPFAEVEELLTRNMRETLSDLLTLNFGEKLMKLSYADIDVLTDSFKFENCRLYQPWIDIFKSIGK